MPRGKANSEVCKTSLPLPVFSQALNLSHHLPFYSSKQMEPIVRRQRSPGFGIANHVRLHEPFPQQAVHSGLIAQSA